MRRLVLTVVLALCGCTDTWMRSPEEKANLPADTRWHNQGMDSFDARSKRGVDLFTPSER